MSVFGTWLALSTWIVSSPNLLYVDSAQGRLNAVSVLDGNPETQWCSTALDGDTAGVQLQFKFDRAVYPDHLFIRFAESSKVQEVRLRNAKASVRYPVRGIALDQPVSRRLSAETLVLDFVPEEGATAPICVTDIRFSAGNKTLTHLSQLSHARASIVGEWAGGPLGAPDRRIVFAVDGTWHLDYRPLWADEGGRPRKVSGRYRWRKGALEMKKRAGSWQRVRWRKRRIQTDDDPYHPVANGHYDELVIKTKLDPLLAGSFNNARFE